MIFDIRNFLIKFAIAFLCTALFSLILIFVILRSFFGSSYIKKADSAYKEGKYKSAIELYETAKYWDKKNQNIYIGLAKTYAAKNDLDTAGKIIDEAIKANITTKENGIEQLHIMRVKIYSASGRFNDAANYIEGLKDQYILKKLQALRPGDIVYSPLWGSYDKTFKVTITVPEGQTVYYTTDGSYPTKYSNIYTMPINVTNGSTRILAISVDSEGLVSPLLDISYEVTNENEAVIFDDAKIEKMVRKALSKPFGDVLVKELESITALSNEGIEGKVELISDLDYMPNIESLYLHGESNLYSISNLAGKSKLRDLDISGCKLSTENISVLGSLTALETVDISNNNINSLDALSDLTTIKYIYLSNNLVTNLTPLKNCKNIEFIDASNNSITAIPDFTSSANLKTLLLKNNSISDLSTLHRLTSLTTLDLENNLIRSCDQMSTLVNLENLTLSGNVITNFDFLTGFTKLTELYVKSTNFMSLKPILNLPITSLDANGTRLTNINGIENFKNLTYLTIADTSVNDISAISQLEKLDYLDISNLNIQDPSPLFNHKTLANLKAEGFDFKGIAFANQNLKIIE